MARAMDAAKFMVAANTPRSREALMLRLRILAVSAMKRWDISSSMARDLMVFAPVMPSLKLPVIRRIDFTHFPVRRE